MWGCSARGGDLRQNSGVFPTHVGMVRARRIIPIANYPGRDDVHLVQCLSPREPPAKRPAPPLYARILGVISFLSTIAVAVFSFKYLSRSHKSLSLS